MIPLFRFSFCYLALGICLPVMIFALTTLSCESRSSNFTPHLTKYYDDGKKFSEIDTVTGYNKIWYRNGKLQAEGKVTKAYPKDYRDSVWKYYDEEGLLIRQETYNKAGKVDSRTFKYLGGNVPISETFQYFEGDYHNKETFKFHEIVKTFNENGSIFMESHSINGALVESKFFDKKGNPISNKPLKAHTEPIIIPVPKQSNK